MLNLNQITETYPEELQKFKRHLLREYLQCKILEIIYTSKYSRRLVFLGGTALRLVYGNQRFSEDLDFDNREISIKEFSQLTNLIEKDLTQQGFVVETKTVSKGGLRSYIKIPKLLHAVGLSGLPDEKITIQIDTSPQNFDRAPRLYTLDRFDVYTKIKVVSPSLLLAQKIHAALSRKRQKGRDFFDISFLINNQKTAPDFDYLEAKLDIGDGQELKERLKKKLRKTDFKELARGVERFLFDPNQRKRVESFYQEIDRWNFSTLNLK